MAETSTESGRAALQADIAQAMRRVTLAEARVSGLIRALVADESVLWYARDAEAQRVFEEAFTAGRAVVNGKWEVGSGGDEDEADDTLG